MNCLFCDIANTRIPADIVCHDEHVVAFNDLHPQAPTHVLIIPRKHIATLNDLHPDDVPLMGHLIYTAHQLAQTLHIAQAGYRVLINCNEGGGQTVFHIHVHLLGGRRFHWPPG